jgi:hypothetical protein
MKDQYMKKISSLLALAGLLFVGKTSAVSLDDIQFWTGTGTNRAALVIEWSVPEDFTYSSVPAPIADKSLVWGYRFNGTATAEQMLTNILAADPRFYAVGSIFPTYGLFVNGIGYHLKTLDGSGLADGTATNYFTSGLQTSTTVDIDAAAPLNTNDLYWGGFNGPNWENWTESNAAGGFFSCPDRGTDAYWTSTDPTYYSAGYHGQWDLGGYGLSGTLLTNGSWFGFSVAAGPYDMNYTPNSPYDAHKHAPELPDPAITALVKNFAGGLQSGNWLGQFVGCTNWNYSLERSTDLQSWSTIINDIPGISGNLNVTDLAPPTGCAFYRIRAEKP